MRTVGYKDAIYITITIKAQVHRVVSIGILLRVVVLLQMLVAAAGEYGTVLLTSMDAAVIVTTKIILLCCQLYYRELTNILHGIQNVCVS